MTNAPRSRILQATLLAAGVAVLLLVTAVLPAEYGIDPTGIGHRLGLTALAGVEEPAPVAPAPMPSAGAPESKLALQSDTYEVELRPFEGVEYKYRLEKGAAIVYEWEAAGVVHFEFHGEPDGAPARYFDSYLKGEAREGRGAFTAEKAGIHGWFWENKSAGRVKVALRASGFFAAATEYRDGERVKRTFGTR